jgi:hypothetical protein
MQYRATEGQTWDVIAYDSIGDEMLMDDLIARNEYSYSDTVTFTDGDVIDIPDVVIREAAVIPSPWG